MLQLDLDHSRAKTRLSLLDEEIENKADEHFDRAREAFRFLRYDEAIAEWEMFLLLRARARAGRPDPRCRSHVLLRRRAGRLRGPLPRRPSAPAGRAHRRGHHRVRAPDRRRPHARAPHFNLAVLLLQEKGLSEAAARYFQSFLELEPTSDCAPQVRSWLEANGY